jgi:glucoamylase
MMGRYPADVYDAGQSGIGHPWAICMCNFAELSCRLATEIITASAIPLDANSAGFFNQARVTAPSTPAAAATGLRAAGDQTLQAIIMMPCGWSSPGSGSPQAGGAVGFREGRLAPAGQGR